MVCDQIREMKYRIRKNEDDLIALFSERMPFSEHLDKWEDEALPDKYDQNFYEYRGQPTREEFAKALEYQKKKGADYIKLEGREPLADSFGLEESVTLTMMLRGEAGNWTTNPDLAIRKPSAEEVEALDVKHYAALYGEDFTRRNVRRQYEKLTYAGAYLEGMLVGSCYYFCRDGLTCIDGLIVDGSYRKRHVATSLIAYIRNLFPDSILYLHADEDDSPKEMYEKMGFETIDRLYEYLCTGIKL